MKRSNRLVILVGVLLAVLAFVAVVVLLNQQQQTVAPEEVTETVLVTTEDIEIGEEVTPDKVETAEVDPAAVVQTPLRDPSQVAGRPALVNIPAGSQITQEAVGLGVVGPANITSQLRAGERAIAFQVDRVTGLDFLIQPGDHIDLVLSSEITVLQETSESATSGDPDAPKRYEVVQGLENQRTVKAILQNKRVLYVSATSIQPVTPPSEEGEEGEQPPAEPIDRVIIVFAGTDQDAEIVKFAQANVNEIGTLSAVLRASNDEAVEETLGITIDQLVAEFGLRIPNVVEQVQDAAPAQ